MIDIIYCITKIMCIFLKSTGSNHVFRGERLLGSLSFRFPVAFMYPTRSFLWLFCRDRTVENFGCPFSLMSSDRHSICSLVMLR
jgi:hypothetical protein